MAKSNQVKLRQIFLGLQGQMLAKLSLNREILKHPVAKGDATELEWIELLSTYLPTRYRVEKAFVIDHRGRLSEQIDVVIFDRHYSPFLFKQNGQIYIPAESVYCVIEIKPKLDAKSLRYAAEKVASVRKLKRTSAPIIDKGKQCEPRPLTYIFGGLLTIDGVLTKALADKLLEENDNKFLDFGCSLGGNAFYIDYKDRQSVEISSNEDSLIFFFLKLLDELQSVGTVAPMEIGEYAKKL
ncbi:MAG: DUF6602 domain-containing protein [Promethearchaeota archaeon]